MATAMPTTEEIIRIFHKDLKLQVTDDFDKVKESFDLQRDVKARDAESANPIVARAAD